MSTPIITTPFYRIKNLTDAERDNIKRRGREGEALCLWELAVYFGYGYSTVRQWKALGMPLVFGKLPVKEAWQWLKKNIMEKNVMVEAA